MIRVFLSLLAVALAYPVGILLFADEWAVGGALVTGTFTVGVSIFVGVPSITWCVRRGWLAPWHAGLGGAIAGLLCSSAFWYGGFVEVIRGAIPFVAIGAIHGLVFWALAFWGNTKIQSGPRNAQNA